MKDKTEEIPHCRGKVSNVPRICISLPTDNQTFFKGSGRGLVWFVAKAVKVDLYERTGDVSGFLIADPRELPELEVYRKQLHEVKN